MAVIDKGCPTCGSGIEFERNRLDELFRAVRSPDFRNLVRRYDRSIHHDQPTCIAGGHIIPWFQFMRIYTAYVRVKRDAYARQERILAQLARRMNEPVMAPS